MSFHAQRATYLLHKISLSSQALQQIINPLDWGWQLSSMNSRHIPTPVWDTDGNLQKIDNIRQSIMHKCACKKTECNPGSANELEMERTVLYYAHAVAVRLYFLEQRKLLLVKPKQKCYRIVLNPRVIILIYTRN